MQAPAQPAPRGPQVKADDDEAWGSATLAAQVPEPSTCPAAEASVATTSDLSLPLPLLTPLTPRRWPSSGTKAGSTARTEANESGQFFGEH